mmetsp:Transcript_109257/g.296267  ORF Transcript_109257/g.296267 Transcript_109257/m.296267 type:complete len:287 (-) Transcript_109257:726-1586(-)
MDIPPHASVRMPGTAAHPARVARSSEKPAAVAADVARPTAAPTGRPESTEPTWPMSSARPLAGPSCSPWCLATSKRCSPARVLTPLMPARLHACRAQAAPKESGAPPRPRQAKLLTASTEVEARPRRAESVQVSAWRPPRLAETTPEKAAPREPPISAQNKRVAVCISVAARPVPRRYMEPHSLVHLEAPKLRLLQKKRAHIAGLRRIFSMAARKVALAAFTSTCAFSALEPSSVLILATAAFEDLLAPPRRSIAWTTSVTKAELAPKLRRVLRQDMPRRVVASVP